MLVAVVLVASTQYPLALPDTYVNWTFGFLPAPDGIDVGYAFLKLRSCFMILATLSSEVRTSVFAVLVRHEPIPITEIVIRIDKTTRITRSSTIVNARDATGARGERLTPVFCQAVCMPQV